MAFKPLPIGVEDFEDIIKKEYYYVDKTLMIKELLDMKGAVNLFTRPRRFGKTLNMSMLRYFFDNSSEEYAKLFESTKIMEAGEKYLAHMGKYPVITLSLKSLKQSDFTLAFEILKRTLKKEYDRHWDFISSSEKLTDADLERYKGIRDLKGEYADYYTALEFLSECLYRCHGQKVIILIDEYDVPLENAYFSGFYDQMIAVIRSLFESALKTNPYLEFAVITGCLRISRESIFTGLNNLKIMSITADSYAEHFGFTQKEVDEMLEFYEITDCRETMKEWYDGYKFGNEAVYNPWSVINYVEACWVNKKAFPRPYWSNTSSNSIVKTLVEQANLMVKQEIEQLIEGKYIEKPIHEDITYEDMNSTPDNLWNFLFFTGYLKKVDERYDGENRYIRMAIPNNEVKYVYKNMVLNWFKAEIKQKDLTALYAGILTGNKAVIENEIEARLKESISFYDNKEAFYHGFLLGLLEGMDDYLIDSNREAGNGRYDICVRSLDIQKPAVIFELKQAENYKELGAKCQEALEQIYAQNYMDALVNEGYQEIICCGISFYKKNCKATVKKENI